MAKRGQKSTKERHSPEQKAFTSKKKWKVNLGEAFTGKKGFKANLQEAFTGVNRLKLNQICAFTYIYLKVNLKNGFQ